MDLYLSVGLPNGYTNFLQGVTFTPVLLSVSVATVSIGGSTITASVKGVGVNDELTLHDEASATDICVSSRVISYGVLECDTDPSFDFTTPITVSVKEVVSGLIHACSNSDPTAC